MSQRFAKIIFMVATIVLTIIVLMFVANSAFNQEAFTARFTSLGYPAYLIFPLSVANVLGLIAIWYRKFATLKNLAYAGFLINFLLAFVAEIGAIDKDLVSPVIATTALVVSYVMQKKSFQLVKNH